MFYSNNAILVPTTPTQALTSVLSLSLPLPLPLSVSPPYQFTLLLSTKVANGSIDGWSSASLELEPSGFEADEAEDDAFLLDETW